MRFVIGDIHGRFEALKEVLKKASFDYDKDKLIVLGDVVDGGPRTYEVVEELLKVKNLVLTLGNHDVFYLNHLQNGWADEIWVQHGGANTLRSYGAIVKESEYITGHSYINTKGIKIPITHREFFNKGIYYHIEDEMLFVHGGIIPNKPMEEQKEFDLTWDRELISYYRAGEFDVRFKKIFIGHTTTEIINGDTEPIMYENGPEGYISSNDYKLICLDTGAGWSGRLTIMDIDTEKYWQSKIQKTGGR